MEDVLHQIVEEETDELRLQLEQKENIILEKDIALKNSKKEKQRAVEQAIIIQFPLNTECIYFGTIDNTNDANEKLIKFGHTNDLATNARQTECATRARELIATCACCFCLILMADCSERCLH